MRFITIRSPRYRANLCRGHCSSSARSVDDPCEAGRARQGAKDTSACARMGAHGTHPFRGTVSPCAVSPHLDGAASPSNLPSSANAPMRAAQAATSTNCRAHLVQDRPRRNLSIRKNVVISRNVHKLPIDARCNTVI